MRNLTRNVEEIDVDGASVRAVITQLDSRFPGIRERLCDGDELKAGTTVSVDGRVSSLGLLEKVRANSEVHFLPAIGGG